MDINSSSSHKNQEPESSVLYLVGTPIGNLNDLSSRSLNILNNVDLVYCEDTRATKKIMTKFSISNHLISFNKHNSHKKIPQIVSNLKDSKSVALVSDAGTPCICDPGEELVDTIRSHNFEVISIPGPCAAISALVSSGFPSSKFIFEGFLPKKKKEREKILKEISENEKTTILYESPHRLKKLLKELKENCGGEREINISRELTKKFEEHIKKDIDNFIELFRDKEVIGEITIVIKGRPKIKNREFDENELRNELKDLVNAGLSTSAASKYLAKKKNISKNLIYNLH